MPCCNRAYKLVMLISQFRSVHVFPSLMSNITTLLFQVTKSNTNPDELGGLANQLTNEFGQLASEAKFAAITAENDEVK